MRGYSFTASAEREIGRDGKEKMSYISMDHEAEMKDASESSDHEQADALPEDNLVTVGSERFRCPDVLPQPSSVGKEPSRLS